MRSFFLFLALMSLLHSEEGFEQYFKAFDDGVGAFKEAVGIYQNNVYFSENNASGYKVAYDPSSSSERDYSFLQIYTSVHFEETLTQYRLVENKKNLYIKKFNQLYFLRLRNEDPDYTREMYIKLKGKYPDIYHSQAVKKVQIKEPEKKKHVISFIKSKHEKITTNILKETVFSISNEEGFPELEAEKIVRQGELEKIDDLKNSSANFAIVRGDVLGIKNAALHGFEAFTNYGILCAGQEEMLYLVSREEISSIYDLRGKSISVGKISNIAQVYLQDIAKDSGVILDINFKSFSLEDSLEKMKKGRLDAFFLFASTDKINMIVDEGLFISSIPDDFSKKLNHHQGLEKFKFKIDERIIKSYKVPNFVVSVVETLDTNLSEKIKKAVAAFSCNEMTKIPDVFYGNLHPELQNAIAAIQAEADAKAQAQRALDERNGAISIVFYKVDKTLNAKTYYYKITNQSSEDINISFEQVKTKAFDHYAFKPRHVLKLQLNKPIIEMKAESKKLISFKYSNPFATRVDKMKLDLHFQEMRMDGKHFSIPLVLGDK